MRRWLIAAVTLILVGVACSSGGDTNAPTPIDTNASHAPVTLEMWSGWTSPREVKQFDAIFKSFTEQYPWITVKDTGGVTDEKLIAGINSGTPPDVALSFGLDNVGKYCQSGAWQDLTPYIASTNPNPEDFTKQFPQSVFKYTSFDGSQCALPFLTDAYGLYYNKDMFKDAGITEPPKTLSELTADAKKLTIKNPDGSIKRMGLVPNVGYYETNAVTYGVPFGAHWYNEDGSASVINSDPQWVAFANWQKDLIDWYGGPSAVTDFVAAAGDEFSTSQDFETGRVAMNMDGEWRTAFLADEAPDLNYGTAPFPVPDNMADTYGLGQIGGTIIGIPKGAQHPDEAWLLVQWMATDTDTLVYMGNTVGNVPTTYAALESPDLDASPQFQTFLDIFKNPGSRYKETSALGSQDQTLFSNFLEKWQAGTATDLQAGLDQVAQEIDDQLAQTTSAP